MRRPGLVPLAACLAALPAAASSLGAASVPVQAPSPAASTEPTLSVMTYNIEGLPFPVRTGRGAAAGHIAAALTAMRAAGTQPQVVVLQEAFGRSQQAIGREAGYRYIAFGPGRHARNPEAASDDDRAFLAGAARLKGEDDGKWAGSGLAILSDYPILSVKRMPFPAWACAGFDCLANKGVMMATVALPGVGQPVAVVATHMNSKLKSSVAPARYNQAFARQVASIAGFLRANLPADMPYVFAGDTNIGRSAARGEMFRAMLASLPRAAGMGSVRTALGTCLAADAACALAQAGEVRKADAHGKDLEVYGDGTDVGLAPIAISAPFGHDAHGRMLSDHIGYTALYRLPPVR